MTILKKFLTFILIQISRNKFVQNLLQKVIVVFQYLMGIGAGGGVSSSGEKIIFKVLSEICTEPYCIFDVGANKGQFLDLALESISTNNFSIHCFEPGAQTFSSLSEREEDDRVTLNNMGLGKKKGQMTLHYDEPGSGLASLTKRKLDHFGIDFDKSETVTIETVDDYCKANQIKKINVLKLDIEGHELDALAGAKEMFARNAIDMVTFEFGGCNIDTRTFFQDFWYFFVNNNMTLYRLTPSGYLFEIESYKEIDEQYRTTNFIAIKKVNTVESSFDES